MVELNEDQFGYRGLHQPALGPPIHNLLEPDPGEKTSVAPSDIYTHMHYYTTGEDRADSESMTAIHRARGDRPMSPRPAREEKTYGSVTLPSAPPESPESFGRRKARRAAGEHPVTVYRAAPKGAGQQLNPGDWVTPSRSYALQHAKHPTDKTQDMPVFKAQVPAKHVRWAADSINEFGYSGPPVKAQVHNRGGKNAPRAD